PLPRAPRPARRRREPPRPERLLDRRRRRLLPLRRLLDHHARLDRERGLLRAGRCRPLHAGALGREVGPRADRRPRADEPPRRLALGGRVAGDGAPARGRDPAARRGGAAAGAERADRADRMRRILLQLAGRAAAAPLAERGLNRWLTPVRALPPWC